MANVDKEKLEPPELGGGGNVNSAADLEDGLEVPQMIKHKVTL